MDKDKKQRDAKVLFVSVVAVRDVHDAPEGAPCFVKLVHGNKTWNTGKKVAFSREDGFEVAVKGAPVLVVSLYVDVADGPKLLGQKSIPVEELREVAHSGVDSTWRLAKAGTPAGDIVLAVEPVQKQEKLKLSKLVARQKSKANHPEDSKKDKEKEKEKEKEDKKEKENEKETEENSVVDGDSIPEDEEVLKDDEAHTGIEVARGSGDTSPAGKHKRERVKSKESRKPAKLAGTFKKGLTMVHLRSDDDEDLSWPEYQAKQASKSVLSPRTGKLSVAEHLRSLSSTQPTLKSLYQLKLLLKERDELDSFTDDGGFFLLASHLLNAHNQKNRLAPQVQLAILDVLRAHLVNENVFKKFVLEEPDTITSVAMVASTPDLQGAVYEFLSALPSLAANIGAAEKAAVTREVVAAMNTYFHKKHEPRRHAHLIDALSADDDDTRLEALKLITLLINARADLEERLAFRSELESAGFDEVLATLSDGPIPRDSRKLSKAVRDVQDGRKQDEADYEARISGLLQMNMNWREHRTLSMLCAALIKRVSKHDELQYSLYSLLCRLIRIPVDPDVGFAKWSILVTAASQITAEKGIGGVNLHSLADVLKNSEALRDANSLLTKEKATLNARVALLEAKVADLERARSSKQKPLPNVPKEAAPFPPAKDKGVNGEKEPVRPRIDFLLTLIEENVESDTSMLDKDDFAFEQSVLKSEQKLLEAEKRELLTAQKLAQKEAERLKELEKSLNEREQALKEREANPLNNSGGSADVAEIQAEIARAGPAMMEEEKEDTRLQTIESAHFKAEADARLHAKEEKRLEMEAKKAEEEGRQDREREQAEAAILRSRSAAIRQWIERVLDETLEGNEEDLHKALMDGVVLCRLANSLKPDSVTKHHSNPRSAMQRIENIALFVEALEKTFGVQPSLIFRPVDLHDEQNLKKVTVTMLELMKISGENVAHGNDKTGSLNGDVEMAHSPRQAGESIAAITTHDDLDESTTLSPKSISEPSAVLEEVSV